jgi:hypothetical protein
MKHLKKFEGFNPYDDEPLSRTEELFGKETRLEKQFSKIVVSGLCSDDESQYWSTFNALEIEVKDEIDEVAIKELQTRVVEGENPTEVMNDICLRIEQNSEIKRLLKKLISILFKCFIGIKNIYKC